MLAHCQVNNWGLHLVVYSNLFVSMCMSNKYFKNSHMTCTAGVMSTCVHSHRVNNKVLMVFVFGADLTKINDNTLDYLFGSSPFMKANWSVPGNVIAFQCKLSFW